MKLKIMNNEFMNTNIEINKLNSKQRRFSILDIINEN